MVPGCHEPFVLGSRLFGLLASGRIDGHAAQPAEVLSTGAPAHTPGKPSNRKHDAEARCGLVGPPRGG